MKEEDSKIIIIDKPIGKSSAFISRIIGRKMNAKKVGHLGTLDPFASGVLPVALNSATKLIHYIKTDKKKYEFEVYFGIKTNTGDLTGEIVQHSNIVPTESQLSSVLNKFKGEIEQIPNPFCALKINGKKSYELARKGIIPNLKKRKITVFDIKILHKIDDNIFKLQASVSSGTYIRTLSEDIATVLGTTAHVKSLRRTVDGQFSISNAITMEECNQMLYNDHCCFVSLEDVLVDIPVIFVSDEASKRMANGLPVPYGGNLGFNQQRILVKNASGFMAIAVFEDGIIHPKRIVCF